MAVTEDVELWLWRQTSHFSYLNLLFLWTSHDVHMRVRRSSPHDVRAGRLVCGRQPGGLRIERPHNHPVRTYSNRRTRCVIRIGIASLRGAGQHVGNSRNAVRWLRFVSAKVRCPLHRSRICAHGRLADNVGIARHAREAIVALAQNHFVALGICIDDSRGLRNIIWSCGHCPSDFFLCRVTCLRRYSVVRTLRFGTAHKSDSNYQKQGHGRDGARQELTSRTFGSHGFTLHSARFEPRLASRPAPCGTALCLPSCERKRQRPVRGELSRSSGGYSPGR
jgi:hypothetical protein